MTRKLASVQRIVDIRPIPEADRIAVCDVLGWQCVINKADGFQVGDLVVYVETDSILPPKSEFEFLKERKYRIRTIKLKKQVSQGIVFPLSILPRGKYNEGDDVTGIIGVRKYDPAADLEAKLMAERQAREKNKIAKFLMRYNWFRDLFVKHNRSSFPTFLKKSDENRIQLFPNICEDEKDTIFSVSEKIDGQSGTFFLVKSRNWFGKKTYKFGVCSRNFLLNKPDNSSYWTIARQLNIESVLRELAQDANWICLQGEIVGAGIQGNKYGVSGYDFYAFNLIFPDKTVDWDTMRCVLPLFGIKVVPYIDRCFRLKPTIQENVEYAKGKSVVADIKREGVVVRNYEKNLSFKIVNADFLLEYGED